VYRPPKIAPMIMEEDKMSKQERNALRRQKETLRKAKHGFMKELIDDMEDRPAEVCCLLFFWYCVSLKTTFTSSLDHLSMMVKSG